MVEEKCSILAASHAPSLMALYIIGDTHGCYRTLRALIDEAGVSRDDELIFVGDLVNRGPLNLDVLRFVADLGERAEVTLGNHDLHLIGRALGEGRHRKKDTIDDVLEAADSDELTAWLRQRPWYVDRPELDLLVLHAGVLPSWKRATVVEEGERLRGRMRSATNARSLIRDSLASRPDRWSPQAKNRDVAAMAVLTRLRVCSADGVIDHQYKGDRDHVPQGVRPWFAHSPPVFDEAHVVFGHWAAWGRQLGARYVATDSGCVWGGELTALRWDDRRVFTHPVIDSPLP